MTRVRCNQNETDWKHKIWMKQTDARGEARHFFWMFIYWTFFLLIFFFPLDLPFVAHEEMRKLIETMPHPTRVDSLSWKLKYFYESCTALEHIVVPEQKLIRIIDQMGMDSCHHPSFIFILHFFISISMFSHVLFHLMFHFLNTVMSLIPLEMV